jgi:hypothetical protein
MRREVGKLVDGGRQEGYVAFTVTAHDKDLVTNGCQAGPGLALFKGYFHDARQGFGDG